MEPPEEPALPAPTDVASPAPPLSWSRRALGWARELLVVAVLFLVFSTVVGKLRAPDLPDQAPGFDLVTLEGQAVSLDDFRGQTVVLNFWATWCAPCRAEIPMLSEFARSHPDIPVLGLAVDGEVEHLRRSVEPLGIDYPVLRAPPSVVAAYGASTVPTTVVVGPGGEVRSAHVGVITNPQLWWATR